MFGYYLVSRDTTLGPFDRERIKDEVRKVGAGDYGYFDRFVEGLNLERTYALERGAWALIAVEVIAPRPVKVVETWALPEE